MEIVTVGAPERQAAARGTTARGVGARRAPAPGTTAGRLGTTGVRGTARGFNRSQHRVMAVPADDAPTAIGKLERAVEKGASLVVNRRDSMGRYVVSTGPKGKPIVLLAPSLNDDLDCETEGGAVWIAHRWFPPRRDGKIAITLRRIAPRHGRPSTYQYHGCRCERCTKANTLMQQSYRKRTARPNAKPEPRHGPACAKRGCHCEIGRAAVRERQRRSRARRRLAAVPAPAEPIGA